MASIAIAGDSSGAVTLQAPAVAGSNTLSLQAVSGTLAPIVSGTAVATTSGTVADFTSIPSWVKRITVMLQGVSTSGTSNLQIQLGTGAGPTYTTSGYLGSAVSTTGATTANYASGLLIASNTAAARVYHGTVTILNISGNSWAASGIVGFSDSGGGNWSAGSIAMGGAVTALRVTTVGGTDTFDAGSINILYE